VLASALVWLNVKISTLKIVVRIRKNAVHGHINVSGVIDQDAKGIKIDEKISFPVSFIVRVKGYISGKQCTGSDFDKKQKIILEPDIFSRKVSQKLKNLFFFKKCQNLNFPSF
jgi:hypothetical protein